MATKLDFVASEWEVFGEGARNIVLRYNGCQAPLVRLSCALHACATSLPTNCRAQPVRRAPHNRWGACCACQNVRLAGQTRVATRRTRAWSDSFGSTFPSTPVLRTTPTKAGSFQRTCYSRCSASAVLPRARLWFCPPSLPALFRAALLVVSPWTQTRMGAACACCFRTTRGFPGNCRALHHPL